MVVEGLLAKVDDESPRELEVFEAGLEHGAVGGQASFAERGDQDGATLGKHQTRQSGFAKQLAVGSDGGDRLAQQRHVFRLQIGSEQSAIGRVAVAQPVLTHHPRR